MILVLVLFPCDVAWVNRVLKVGVPAFAEPAFVDERVQLGLVVRRVVLFTRNGVGVVLAEGAVGLVVLAAAFESLVHFARLDRVGVGHPHFLALALLGVLVFVLVAAEAGIC